MNKRSYGNALDQLEPGDLNDCLCPNQEQLDMIADWETAQIIEIAKTEKTKAIIKSNQLIDRITHSQRCIRQTTKQVG